MLDAAASVFSRRGYHAASMDEIAELAGISKPMVYAYHGSKEDLFLATIRREGARLTGAITAAVAPGLPPDEQLWRGLRALFTFVGEHREGWAVLYRQARARGEPFADEIAAQRGRIVAVVESLLGEAMRAHGRRRLRAGELTAFAHALVGAGESLADWAVDHPDERPQTMARRLMNFAWMGFGDLLRGETWSPAPSRTAGTTTRKDHP